MVRTEVPVPPAARVTGLTLKVVVRPITGVPVDAVRVTLPENPLRLVKVTVETPEEPDVKGLVEPTETRKSSGVP